MPKLSLKDVLRCPHCAGAEIIYSCEPKCCFNHVCPECRTTFQVVTEKTGRFDRETPIAAEEPGSGDPTTGCAACDSLRLALVSSDAPNSGTMICADCRAVLRLEIDEVAVGNL